MKWLLPILVLCAAGGGIWYLLSDETDGGYGPGEARGGDVLRSSDRASGMRAKGGERLGVYGKASLPAELLPTDAWMEKPLVWPARGARVTGKDLAESLSAAVPVRFLNQGEMDAFMGHAFMDEAPEGDGDLGMLTGLLDGSGYVMEIRERFVLLRALRKGEFTSEQDG